MQVDVRPSGQRVGDQHASLLLHAARLFSVLGFPLGLVPGDHFALLAAAPLERLARGLHPAPDGGGFLVEALHELLGRFGKVSRRRAPLSDRLVAAVLVRDQIPYVAIVAALVPLLGLLLFGKSRLQIGQVHVDRIVGDALLENDFGRNEHDTERQVGNDHAAQPDPVLVSP